MIETLAGTKPRKGRFKHISPKKPATRRQIQLTAFIFSTHTVALLDKEGLFMAAMVA